MYTSGLFKFRASPIMLAEVQRAAPDIIMERAMAAVWFEGLQTSSDEMRAQLTRLKTFLTRCMRGEMAMRCDIWRQKCQQCKRERLKHEGVLTARVGMYLMEHIKSEKGFRLHVWAESCRKDKREMASGRVRGYQIMYIRQVILNRVGGIIRKESQVLESQKSREVGAVHTEAVKIERRMGAARMAARTLMRLMRDHLRDCVQSWRTSLRVDKEKALRKILDIYLRMEAARGAQGRGA